MCKKCFKTGFNGYYSEEYGYLLNSIGNKYCSCKTGEQLCEEKKNEEKRKKNLSRYKKNYQNSFSN